MQPYATIVTKDYPDNEQSALNPAGRWRVNVHVGLSRSATLTGGTPGDITASDFRAADVFLPHPVFGALGWIAVVNPGPQTESTVVELLRAAHGEARRRMDRRSDLNAVGKPAPDH